MTGVAPLITTVFAHQYLCFNRKHLCLPKSSQQSAASILLVTVASRGHPSVMGVAIPPGAVHTAIPKQAVFRQAQKEESGYWIGNTHCLYQLLRGYSRPPSVFPSAEVSLSTLTRGSLGILLSFRKQNVAVLHKKVLDPDLLPNASLALLQGFSQKEKQACPLTPNTVKSIPSMEYCCFIYCVFLSIS